MSYDLPDELTTLHTPEKIARLIAEADAHAADDGPHATWKPVVGTIWPKGSTCPHGPGAVFKPDGSGGGTLTWTERVVVRRKGFRDRVVERPVTITKRSHLAT